MREYGTWERERFANTNIRERWDKVVVNGLWCSTFRLYNVSLTFLIPSLITDQLWLIQWIMAIEISSGTLSLTQHGCLGILVKMKL